MSPIGPESERSLPPSLRFAKTGEWDWMRWLACMGPVLSADALVLLTYLPT